AGLRDQAGAISRHRRDRAGKRRHNSGGTSGERRQLPEPGCGIAPTRDRPRRSLAIASFERALDFAIRSPAREHVALVVRVLAFGEPKLNLGASVLEVNFQRDDRVALLAHAAPQAIDLAPMHQQFSRASFLVAELARRRVSADVHALEKRLAVLDARVTVAQICAMRPQRLDLGAREREAGLDSLLDKEVMPRLAVVDDQIKSVSGRFTVAAVRITRHISVSLSAQGDADKGSIGMVANAVAEP